MCNYWVESFLNTLMLHWNAVLINAFNPSVCVIMLDPILFSLSDDRWIHRREWRWKRADENVESTYHETWVSTWLTNTYSTSPTLERESYEVCYTKDGDFNTNTCHVMLGMYRLCLSVCFLGPWKLLSADVKCWHSMQLLIALWVLWDATAIACLFFFRLVWI